MTVCRGDSHNKRSIPEVIEVGSPKYRDVAPNTVNYQVCIIYASNYLDS